MSIILELREAQKLYEDAGVDGSEGARMMRASADEIERLTQECDDARGLFISLQDKVNAALCHERRVWEKNNT